MQIPTSYEELTLCDSCGCLVSRLPLDGDSIELTADILDPSLAETDGNRTDLMDEGDLLPEDAGRPVETIVRHVAACGRCSPGP